MTSHTRRCNKTQVQFLKQNDKKYDVSKISHVTNNLTQHHLESSPIILFLFANIESWDLTNPIKLDILDYKLMSENITFFLIYMLFGEMADMVLGQVIFKVHLGH